MADEHPIELEFPLEFPLKVFGIDEDNFEQFVTRIVRRHVPDLLEEKITTHKSSAGKYIAVSYVFFAQSRAQVDALYEELSSHKRIVTIL
jgi:uncharacterized protein